MSDYANAVGRWFDIRLKASNTRINCAILYGCSIGHFVTGGNLIESIAMAAIAGALWAIRDKQDGQH